VPDRPLEEEQLITLRHLDEELLSTPSLALNRARMELVQMSGVVEEMHQNILPAIIKGSPSDLQSLAREDQKVDRLHQEIIRYMGQISGNKLSEVEATELSSLFEITNALENIGDLIETDMVELGLQRIEEEINISPQTVSVLQGIHTMVAQSLTSVTAAIKTEHSAEANQVVDMKTEFNLLVNSAHQHQMERLTADESKRIQTYSLEVEVIEKLKRIYYFSKRIAKAAA